MLAEYKNYYQVLEIEESSNQEEIFEGYTKVKNAYHQDNLALYSLMTEEECHQILEAIEEAYDILSHPDKRIEYDRVKGFNQNTLSSILSPSEHSSSDFEETEALESTSQNSITKLITKERFSLKYNVDLDFEKKIEQTAEWTGKWLKQIREYKGVDIKRLADITRISKSYLKSIEEELFEDLPSLAYVRGFVYQYAKYLKLNPELVCSSYIHRLKQAKEK